MESGSVAHSIYALMSAVFRPLLGHMDRQNHKLLDTNTVLFVAVLPLSVSLSPFFLNSVWVPLSYSESICCRGIPPRPKRREAVKGGGGWGLVKIWKEITERDFLQLKNQKKYPCKSKSSKTILFITQTDANNNVCVISSSLLVNVHHSHKGSHNSSID